MAAPAANVSYSPKRLIVCCDGTWMNSESAYVKPTLLKPKGSLQIPSNVTRISRCFRRRCSDGRMQVIEYESGVGTGSNTLDTLTGGAFGLGLGEASVNYHRVRNIYSFLCANYCDGDEIILVGFSRGAYIVRSVAGMISDLGLLTREGVEHFWPIFKDMENWNNHRYRDEFPTMPFDNKPKGDGAAEAYRAKLEKLGMTRVRQSEGQGDIIKVKAVAVWDTVGSLGIPQIAWLNKLGIYASNREFRFWDTSLSDRVEHAFQALALDETRYSFQPAVWERLKANRHTTDLRQVWFPGNHSNCGGGWNDQGISNITLAWMMDQLASIGVEFNHLALERCVQQSKSFYQAQIKAKSIQWAMEPVYGQNHPLRPWGLGSIQKTSNLLYTLAGKIIRSPGLYKQVNAHTDARTATFLTDTNERIHSSVRIRLACKGLGLNDLGEWDNPAMKKNWRLVYSNAAYEDPVPHHPVWEPESDQQECMKHPADADSDGRWVWEYCGPKENAPTSPNGRTMVEEPLGPYERHLLKLTGGDPSIYQYVQSKEGTKRALEVESS